MACFICSDPILMIFVLVDRYGPISSIYTKNATATLHLNDEYNDVYCIIIYLYYCFFYKGHKNPIWWISAGNRTSFQIWAKNLRNMRFWWRFFFFFGFFFVFFFPIWKVMTIIAYLASIKYKAPIFLDNGVKTRYRQRATTTLVLLILTTNPTPTKRRVVIFFSARMTTKGLLLGCETKKSKEIVRSLGTCWEATHELQHLHQHRSSHGDYLVDDRGGTRWWYDSMSAGLLRSRRLDSWIGPISTYQHWSTLLQCVAY